MNENSHHLISRLKWDTTFDNKERAVELQERLSDWSAFHLQQEMSAVFDKLCPPEQTWRIQSLELDLGTIDFNNLEQELPLKLRQQLHEKLTELILYSHQHGHHIEILDEKRSPIQLILYFLEHGLLPWNYQSADGSVNQMLTMQLQSNREELIAMLKESGRKAEQIRKRMAWQFSEPNMIKIIEGIEPNVGGQIISFSNELTRVLQKETVVQVTSTTDFKRNIWFWVLNYLLTERGTVFNRIQFMKSTIMQMAAHYNMQYDQLFELIELAVGKLSQSLSLQPDFIITLQLLSTENKVRKKNTHAVMEEVIDYWPSLVALFSDRTLRRSAGNKSVFNDLVMALSVQYKERFLALINSYGSTADFWLPLINDLSDDTLKTVFSSLRGSQSLILTESILFVNQLTGGVQPNNLRNLLWYEGMMLVREQSNSSSWYAAFLHSLVTVIGQRKQLSKIAVLDQLMAAEVPYSLKSLLHMEIYHTFTAVFMTEVSGTPTILIKKHLQQLMEIFHEQVITGKKNQKLMAGLQNTLENYVRLHPEAVKEAFIATPYQQSLQLILPSSITGIAISGLNLPGVATGVKEPGVYAPQEAEDLLQEMMLHDPEKFLELVKEEMIADPQLIWLNKTVSFSELLHLIGRLEVPRQLMLDNLGQLYRALGTISVSGTTASEMQFILFKKVMRAWTAGNWKLIDTENIWKELLWELCTKKRVAKKEFLSRMEQAKLHFPPSLRLSLELMINQGRSSGNTDKANKSAALSVLPSKGPTPVLQDQQELLKGGLMIKNAGLVLVNGYLPVLLSRLALINEEKKFISKELQLAAVHYLQYVVTGLSSTEEALLPLNKLLSGIPLAQPVMESIEISATHQQLINGLIEAVIGHWPAIGKCSVYGFRGNWLVRDGLLTEKEDRWELTVEKRAYDLLINKSPFSFSVIRYPWMDKPLHVNWSY